MLGAAAALVSQYHHRAKESLAHTSHSSHRAGSRLVHFDTLVLLCLFATAA